MNVAAVQTDLVWEDAAANRDRLAPRVAAAAAAGAGLVLLPEMFPTGFSMRTDVTVEPVDGPSTEWLVSQAASHGVHVGGSIATDDGGDLPVNRFVVADGDGVVAHYDKIHPFGYGNEADHFRGGDDLRTVTLGETTFGLFVCYDLRFANVFWDLAAEVDAYVVVANWPEARRHHWRSLLVARAIENQAWVVGVNRIGTGGGLHYVGDSLVVDPLGDVVADAGAADTTLQVDVDWRTTAEVRTALPFLQDRITRG